jgi:BCD family chlorophyll transporter-like MFS transporter
MMIAGFAVTSGAAGALLDPYSPSRLVLVTTGVCLLALALTLVCVRGLEGPAAQPADPAGAPAEQARFIHALGQVWREPVARRFTVFVFLSMLAYSAQDLILEPFAGTVFGLTPGQSTSLSGVQHGGVLLGMLLMALAATVAARMGWPAGASLRGWTTGGCLLSAAALASLAGAGLVGPGWPMRTTVFVLGVANGVFSIGAISSMMRLAAEGRHAREGVRMGLWGAAQAIAFGLGGLLGTAASDLARWLIASPGAAYGSVFALEALLFLLSAVLAWRLAGPQESQRSAAGTAPGFPGAATSLSTE